MPYPPWLRSGPPWDAEASEHWRARRSWRGRVFAAALSAIVQLPGLAFVIGRLTHHGAALPVPDGQGLIVLGYTLLGFVAAGMLLLPWRGPVAVVVAMLALPSIAEAYGPPLAGLAVAFAVGRAVLGGSAVWAWSTLAGMGAVGAVALAVAGGGSGSIRVVIVTIILCIIAAAATGAGVRRERFRAIAREETSRRRTAAEEERLRIARELHDVLAHSLSQISVQAGVGLHLFDDEPERAKESLRSIRETSTTALDEVRSVLGVLREGDAGEAVPHAPGPSLTGLPALFVDARSSGIDVTVSGMDASLDDVPAAVQAAAYRIVQESLTNVLRHAASSRSVAIAFDARPDALGIVIVNPGPVQGGPVRGAQDAARHIEGSHPTAGGGRGIRGMQERASALGGSLEAGRMPDGGFRVRARLPYAAGRPSGRGEQGRGEPGGAS